MEDFQRILVVSRLTAECRLAVEMGVFLARRHGAGLYVMLLSPGPFDLDSLHLPERFLPEEYGKYISTTYLGKFEKMAMGPQPPGNEIDDWLYSGFYPEQPHNRSHVADAELNKLLELRKALQALKGPLGNLPAFRKKLQTLLKAEGDVDRILKELGTGGAGSTEGGEN